MTYPTIRPEITLDFANSRQLDPRITFSRSSSATYLNPDTGLITLASDHEARLEKEGLLIEASNSNVLQHNTQPDNSYYDLSTGLTKTANNAVSPDGSQTALLLTEDSSTGLHTWGKTTNVPVTNNVMSLFVKSNGATKVGFRQGGESYANTRFDLSTGTKTYGNGGIEAYPNGWYRIWQIRSGNGNKVLFHLLGDSNELSFQGDGTSGVWVWGFQKEPNIISRPTSLIVTAASGVTRAADVCTIEGDNISSWYNPSESTFVAKYTCAYGSAQAAIFGAGDGTGNNVISLRPRNTFAKSSGVNQFNVSLYAGATPPNVQDTIGFSLDSFGAYLVNTNASDSDITSVTMPVGINKLVIGKVENAFIYLNGYISRIAYYSRRLTNAELEAITL